MDEGGVLIENLPLILAFLFFVTFSLAMMIDKNKREREERRDLVITNRIALLGVEVHDTNEDRISFDYERTFFWDDIVCQTNQKNEMHDWMREGF